MTLNPKNFDLTWFFGDFWLQKSEMDGDRLRLPANRNWYRLSRVLWALLKLLVVLLTKGRPSQNWEDMWSPVSSLASPLPARKFVQVTICGTLSSEITDDLHSVYVFSPSCFRGCNSWPTLAATCLHDWLMCFFATTTLASFLRHTVRCVTL